MKTNNERPEVRIEKTREYIRYDFTPEELAEVAQFMARQHQQLQAKEEEKKAVVSQFKSDIDGLTSTIAAAGRKLVNGYEHRHIDCEWRFFCPDRGQKTLVRLDTGEIVRTLAMTQDELQEKLPFAPVEE